MKQTLRFGLVGSTENYATFECNFLCLHSTVGCSNRHYDLYIMTLVLCKKNFDSKNFLLIISRPKRFRVAGGKSKWSFDRFLQRYCCMKDE